MSCYTYSTGSYIGKSPDYNNERLLNQIVFFIKALAAKYDGDPRIACIETGIIGHWGEHHVYYCESTQKIADTTWRTFFKTFSESFSKTQLAVRSPSHPGVSDYAKLGYYNDMLYSDSDDAYFRKMLNTNSVLWDRWKTAMITGEFAPGLQADFLSSCGTASVFSTYRERITEFHISSLLCSKAFSSGYDKEAVQKASDAMGYNFRVSSIKLSNSENKLNVSLVIKNTGIAPFYYAWPVQLALLADGSITQKYTSSWDITQVTAGGEKAFNFSQALPENMASGDCTVLLGVKNPMENGIPLTFANEEQDKDAEGWLTLGILSF